MTDNEDFIRRCAGLDFDKQGLAQARVWAKASAPRRPRTRRWAAVCGAAVLLFVGGFAAARWTDHTCAAVPGNYADGESYFLTCELKTGGEHPKGCVCRACQTRDGKRVWNCAARGESPSRVRVFKECTDEDDSSFYPACTEC